MGKNKFKNLNRKELFQYCFEIENECSLYSSYYHVALEEINKIGVILESEELADDKKTVKVKEVIKDLHSEIHKIYYNSIFDRAEKLLKYRDIIGLDQSSS